jgi:hypothetical protein
VNWGALVPPSFGMILKFKPKLERPVAEGREHSTRSSLGLNMKSIQNKQEVTLRKSCSTIVGTGNGQSVLPWPTKLASLSFSSSCVWQPQAPSKFRAIDELNFLHYSSA